MRKIFSMLLAATMVAGVVGAAHGAAKPMEVWTDPTGDADNGQGTGASIPAGFDLVSGTIVKNGKNLDFAVTHADMPPTGSLPEAVRFMWGFSVGSESYRVTAKAADIGKPNPMTQSDTDRIGKVDPAGFFRLEGNCGSTVVGALNAINCETIGYLAGAFDPATKTLSFSVPLAAIKAKAGSAIGPGGGDAIAICSICWVSHAAERSLDATIIDETAQAKTYKVPR